MVALVPADGVAFSRANYPLRVERALREISCWLGGSPHQQVGTVTGVLCGLWCPVQPGHQLEASREQRLAFCGRKQVSEGQGDRLVSQRRQGRLAARLVVGISGMEGDQRNATRP